MNAQHTQHTGSLMHSQANLIASPFQDNYRIFLTSKQHPQSATGGVEIKMADFCCHLCCTTRSKFALIGEIVHQE